MVYKVAFSEITPAPIDLCAKAPGCSHDMATFFVGLEKIQLIMDLYSAAARKITKSYSIVVQVMLRSS